MLESHCFRLGLKSRQLNTRHQLINVMKIEYYAPWFLKNLWNVKILRIVKTREVLASTVTRPSWFCAKIRVWVDLVRLCDSSLCVCSFYALEEEFATNCISCIYMLHTCMSKFLMQLMLCFAYIEPFWILDLKFPPLGSTLGRVIRVHNSHTHLSR